MASIRSSSRGLGVSGGIASGAGDGVQRWVSQANRHLRRGRLWVGFPKGATYPDGTPVALVAAVQEFGSPSRGIPPRPFFRSALAEHKSEWPRDLARFMRDGGMDSRRALMLLGERISGQVRESILTLQEPPLSPRTIKKKGFDKPLIDTSQMLRTVTYGVRD